MSRNTALLGVFVICVAGFFYQRNQHGDATFFALGAVLSVLGIL